MQSFLSLGESAHGKQDENCSRSRRTTSLSLAFFFLTRFDEVSCSDQDSTAFPVCRQSVCLGVSLRKAPAEHYPGASTLSMTVVLDALFEGAPRGRCTKGSVFPTEEASGTCGPDAIGSTVPGGCALRVAASSSDALRPGAGCATFKCTARKTCSCDQKAENCGDHLPVQEVHEESRQVWMARPSSTHKEPRSLA